MYNNITKTTNDLIAKSEGLTYLGTNASTEGVTDLIKNLGGFFSTKLKTISFVFGRNKSRTDSVVSAADLNTFARELVKVRPQIKDIVTSYEYSDIMVYTVPTIPGLKTNFLIAAKTTSDVLVKYYSPIENCLEKLDTLVSNIIGDPNYGISARPVKEDQECAKISDTLNKELNNIIGTKNLQDATKFKNVFPNMKSVLETYEILVNVSSGTTLDNLIKLSKRCSDIDDKIKALVDSIERSEITLTKPVINKLSFELENTANAVTYLVSFSEIYNKLVNCVTSLTNPKVLSNSLD